MKEQLLLNVDVLKRLRKAQGLSQEGLAFACEQHHLRVSIATIKRAESNKSVSLRTVRELARYFNVKVDSLLQPPTLKRPILTTQTPTTQSDAQPGLLTILWVRIEDDAPGSDVLNLLQRRGCIWHEQLGSIILAAFGNISVNGKGHLHAQHVVLEIRRLLQKSRERHLHFYAAIRLGALHQDLGHNTLSPDVLQWFASQSTSIPPDGIVVSEDLYRISNIHFSYLKLGKAPSELWLLQDAICLEQKLPLVGRSSELLQINAILDGVGHRTAPAIAHITGPAGIGKSRLLTSIHEQARLRDILIADIDLESAWGEPGQILTSRVCSSLFARAKDKWSKQKVRDMLFNDTYSIEEQLIFADLLDITPPAITKNERWRTAAIPNEERRLKAMALIFKAMIAQRIHSILVVIDNLHLSGQAGLGWFVRILEHCRHLPLTFIVTSRIETNTGIELQQLATEGFTISTLLLGRLEPSEVSTICEAFPHQNKAYMERCIDLAEGIPLYLIQLLSNASSAPSKEMPSSLKLLVEHKLSLLNDEDRQVIEVLSVFDAPAPLAIIEDMLRLRDYSPERLAVTQLARIDLDLNIKFCHQLVRHIIYHQLDETARRNAHRMVAHYLEVHGKDTVGQKSYTLARHLEAAADYQGASRYNYLAACQLLHKGLYDDALKLLNKTMELLSYVEKPFREELELDIHLALSTVYKVKYGWVSPLLKSSYQRIDYLCRHRVPDKRHAVAIFGLWAIELATLNFKSAEELAHRCLQISEQLDDAQGKMHAYTALSNTLFWRGLHKQAEDAAQKALQLYRPAFSSSSIKQLGQDPRALAGCFGALSASLLRATDRAESHRRLILNKMKELGHDFSLAIALQCCAWLDYHQGDAEQVLLQGQALEQLSIRMGFPFYRGVAALFLGWANHKLSNLPEAAVFVETGYHQWLASSGDKIAYSLYCTILGEIYIDTDRFAEAIHLLEYGIAFALEHDEACYLPEMYRLLSHCVPASEREPYLRRGLTYTSESPMFAARLRDRLNEET